MLHSPPDRLSDVQGAAKEEKKSANGVSALRVVAHEDSAHDPRDQRSQIYLPEQPPEAYQGDNVDDDVGDGGRSCLRYVRGVRKESIMTNTGRVQYALKR